MSEGNNKKSEEDNWLRPSPLEIWLHPKRTFRHIETLNEELNAERGARTEATEIAVRQASEHAKAIEEISSSKAELAVKLREQEKRVQQQELEITKLKEDLTEYSGIESIIEDFNKKLEGFEEVKKGYEARISTLRLQLDEMRRRLREASAGNDIVSDPKPIDMRQRRRPNEKDPSGWFQVLDDDI